MKTTPRLRGLIVVLQALTLLGQWTGSPRIAPAAAQVPDPGAQRLQQLEELKGINARLDRLVTLLESGKLQVQTNSPDDKDGQRR
jgi:hypothetical protein